MTIIHYLSTPDLHRFQLLVLSPQVTSPYTTQLVTDYFTLNNMMYNYIPHIPYI